MCGFSDAGVSFQIKTVLRFPRCEARLNFQLIQKTKGILVQIQTYLGGNVGAREGQEAYHYNSTTFGSARNVIHYFDRRQLLSSKHSNYLKWRKAYLIIQRHDHLSAIGWDKIIKLKSSMNPSVKNNVIEDIVLTGV